MSIIDELKSLRESATSMHAKVLLDDEIVRLKAAEVKAVGWFGGIWAKIKRVL